MQKGHLPEKTALSRGSSLDFSALEDADGNRLATAQEAEAVDAGAEVTEVIQPDGTVDGPAERATAFTGIP